jgi:hypothetical protein
MNRLTDEQWLLATRYVNQATTQQDHTPLQSLWLEFPELQSALDLLANSDTATNNEFNPVTAFEKLSQRLKEDGLV